MWRLGRNAHGEVLRPGRVPGCHLGLRLDPAGAAATAGCWWSTRPRCCVQGCRSRTAPCCTNC
jgi:hypothetical protein